MTTGSQLEPQELKRERDTFEKRFERQRGVLREARDRGRAADVKRIDSSEKRDQQLFEARSSLGRIFFFFDHLNSVKFEAMTRELINVLA